MRRIFNAPFNPGGRKVLQEPMPVRYGKTSRRVGRIPNSRANHVTRAAGLAEEEEPAEGQMPVTQVEELEKEEVIRSASRIRMQGRKRLLQEVLLRTPALQLQVLPLLLPVLLLRVQLQHPYQQQHLYQQYLLHQLYQ
jgi:hypothetical protein